MVGAVVSSIVNVAVVEEEFPQASVEVNVTVADPVAPQSSLSPLKLLDQEMPEQTSEEVAPPYVASQLLSSTVLPAPSHSTVKLDAEVISGFVVSTIVNVATVEEEFPQASVDVKITVAEPVAPQSSEREVKLLLHV